MTLRDEIGTTIFNAMFAAVESTATNGSESGPYPGWGEYADAILDLIRERPLSGEALVAAADGLDAYEDHIRSVGSVEGASQPSSGKAASSWAITAALDAAGLGADVETGEDRP